MFVKLEAYLTGIKRGYKLTDRAYRPTNLHFGPVNSLMGLFCLLLGTRLRTQSVLYITFLVNREKVAIIPNICDVANNS